MSAELCCTCLSAGRRLRELRAHARESLRLLALSTEPSAVCWECEALLLKMHRFRDDAGAAQAALRLYRENNLSPAPYPLETKSHLKISSIMIDEITSASAVVKPEASEPASATTPDEIKTEPYSVEIDFTPIDEHTQSDDSDVPIQRVKNKRGGQVARDGEAKGERVLRKKLKRERKRPDLYKCKECGKEFKTRGTFEYHKESHREKPQCEDCGRTFVSKSTLWTHRQLVHLESRRWPCEVCRKVFFTEAGHAAHASSHRDGDDRYFCQPCGKFFKTNSSYRKHRRSAVRHVDPGGLRFGCAECDRRFPTEERAREHHEVIHLHKNKFACQQCPRQYCTARALRIHERVKHELESRPRDQVCELCGKGFRTSQVLKSHIRTHTGERPYGCRVCPARFTQSGALHTHTKLVHLNMKRGKKKADA